MRLSTYAVQRGSWEAKIAFQMGEEETVGAETEPKINPITRQPWTEEDRRLASERAKEQVARGEIGGARHGRRKRLPAYAVIAAKAQENGSKLAKELLQIAEHGSTEKLRMDAIKLLVDIEQKSKQERREEEEHLKRLPRGQLVRAIVERISELTGEDYDIDLDLENDVEEEDDGNKAEVPALPPGQ